MQYLRKNDLFLARPHAGMLTNSNENYRRHTFQSFANSSENIKFPENLQP